MARLTRQYPGDMRQWGALVDSFTGISIGPVKPLMRLLLATVGLVLLIACGNAANLLLAHAAGEDDLGAVTPSLGRKHDFSSAKAQRILGWRPRPLEETVLDCARSLIATGAV